MKIYISKILLLVLSLAMAITLYGCSKNKYYDDESGKMKSRITIDGKNELSLLITDGITLENEKVRIILNEDGSVREYANKESHLYLVKDMTSGIPIRVNKRDGGYQENLGYIFEVVEDNTNTKKVSYTYIFSPVIVKTQITLHKNSDEVIFNLELTGNVHKDPVLDIEYPILDGITTLQDKETDYFATPYATGYLFNNPVDAFNGEGGTGLGKNLSLYPTGWYYTMQFATYYSQNLGGFYWQTKDSGDTIKSLSFVGMGDSLKLSVYHYLDDLKDGDTKFDYDFIIANMNEGNWYEAANKYRDWAQNQPWVQNRKLTERDDYAHKLYENTSLVNFGYRASEASWNDMISIYDQIASRIDNNIFNVSIYNNRRYYELVREYGHDYVCFEFHSITNDPKYFNNKMINAAGRDQIFNLNGATWYYQCASNEDWLNYRMEVDDGFKEKYDVDGFYFDVSFTAVHPIQCFDEKHAHGSRVNVLRYFNQQLLNAANQSSEYGMNSVGVEMITEQVIPYVDFYQARANGGILGWMEDGAIRYYVDNNIAIKIPLFDYVYHEYGALRMDGYLVPDEQLSGAYYHIAAYTVLNGGIPEYNFEFYPADDLPAASMINIDMVDFINLLGNVRSGFGKDYLVYGKMQKSPVIGTGKASYECNNPNIGPSNGTFPLGGTAIVDEVVISTYEYNDKIAIFFSNITEEDIDVDFILKALRDYGIEEGDVVLTSTVGDEGVRIARVKNGIAKIRITLKSRQVYMIEIKK